MASKAELNTLIEQTNQEARTNVPYIDGDLTDSCLRAFGESIKNNDLFLTKFGGLMIRIASRKIVSKFYENPLEFLFEEQDYGIGIEEVFINITKPMKYDPFGEGEEVWKRNIPDIRSVLHIINIKTLWEQTIYTYELLKAFNSLASWDDFKSKLISNILSSMNAGLYKAVKYLIALYMVETGVVFRSIGNYNANPKEATVQLQEISDDFTFLKRGYNPAGVENHTPKEDQYLFVTPSFNAKQDVEVLAYMFQIEKGELPMRKILVDDFWNHDYETLDNMFTQRPRRFTEQEIELLKKIPAFICDRGLLFIYRFLTFASQPFNDRKLYWNHYQHFQGTMSYSPFANAVALYEGDAQEATKIMNPYGVDSIEVGRDNQFYPRTAMSTGFMAVHEPAEVSVTGNGLKPIPHMPGWYQASNDEGNISTITYTYKSLDPVTVTVTIV